LELQIDIELYSWKSSNLRIFEEKQFRKSNVWNLDSRFYDYCKLFKPKNKALNLSTAGQLKRIQPITRKTKIFKSKKENKSSEKELKPEPKQLPKEKIEKIIKWKEGLWAEIFLVPDLSLNIVSFLDFKSIQNLSKASKELYPILQSEDCWQSLTKNQILVKEKPENDLTWKQFYVYIICDHLVSFPKDFGGAWSPGNNYWEIKQQTALNGNGFVYYLKNGLWWFDANCHINKGFIIQKK
jgi:hypothetical protein